MMVSIRSSPTLLPVGPVGIDGNQGTPRAACTASASPRGAHFSLIVAVVDGIHSRVFTPTGTALLTQNGGTPPHSTSMCLIAIAWQAHPDYPLVVAANRDEWRDRPAAPAHWWSDHPQLLAGRDLQAGGTWMGVTRRGRFAAVTNFRDPSERRSTALSRGALVADFLLGSAGPAAYLDQLAGRAAQYNAFNLLVSDGRTLFYFGSREGGLRTVEPGVHALSNHLLDEPWPKVAKARRAMQEAIGDGDEPLFAMLSDPTRAPDDQLPDTGVGLERERLLSAALITGEAYGTRASTVLRVGTSVVHFEERTRDGAGFVTSTRAFGFPIEV